MPIIQYVLEYLQVKNLFHFHIKCASLHRISPGVLNIDTLYRPTKNINVIFIEIFVCALIRFIPYFILSALLLGPTRLLPIPVTTLT
jgi:hypothetical protein